MITKLHGLYHGYEDRVVQISLVARSIQLRLDQKSALLIGKQEGARYGVIFSIICTAPFHTFILAYRLLRFQMENIQSTGIHLFNMVSLSFRYHENGVYGTMIFDRDFRAAYVTAKLADATWNDGGRLTLHQLISLINKAA